MKPGQEIKCPHCGKNSFLKKISVTEGWTQKGEILACVSCSAKIADFDPSSSAENKSEKLSKLSVFLDEKEETAKPQIKISDEEKRFCKDCANFIKHPFADRCALTDKVVNPMHDCAEFKKIAGAARDEKQH
jgi:hypothetical protein